MKNFKRILAVLLCALCLFTFNITASAAEFGDSVNDAVSNWAGSQGEKEMVYTRPMFEHEKTVIAADLGLENFGSLYDIYATDELWEEDLKKAKGLLPRIAAYAGKPVRLRFRMRDAKIYSMKFEG